MVCDPGANNINIPAPGPGQSLPGLGLPFSIPKPPFPDVKIPEGIPEDIIDLLNRIFALFPQGIKFIPNTDAMMKGIWDALASLFNQLAPFLAFYKFIQALLNIILCIIDVLCALFNPWATVRALRRLFKRCLPDFLSLFPWIALIIMILALILLLIELIKYIIAMIIAYIKQIIENIEILTRAFTVADADSILAAVNKIAYLLCMIEQLFSIFMAIAAIIAIIEPLMTINGRGVCRKGDSCCTEDFCPSFIGDSLDGGFGSETGRLIYFRKIGPNAPDDSLFDWLRSLNFALRDEMWQFVDDEPGDVKFVDIIVPSPQYGFTYWPEGESYDSDANIVRVPYLLDMNVWLDPAEWGNPDDVLGYREFNIRDIVVHQRPTVYPEAWNGSTDVTDTVSGALVLVGGSVYEYTEDGYSQYKIGDIQATLQTLISKDTLVSSNIPINDDGYSFLDISYKFRYNYEVLVDKKLITAMCQPDTSAESAVLNAEFGDHSSVFDKLGDFPDIGSLNADRTDGTGTLGCLARSLTKFRRNLNKDTAEEFQAESIACLEDLLTDARDFYCRGAAATADRFTTELSIDPDIQWINKEIDVTVRLKDKTGTQIAVNVEKELGDCLASLIKANVSLGNITNFEYDGYGNFTAVITSNEPGVGELTVTLKDEFLAKTINRDNEDELSEIIERVIPYEFIDKTTNYRREQADEARTKYGPPNIAEDGN
jgi:hypothetical protein